MHSLTFGVISGMSVGLVLGLIGGGGSICAVPLLIYVVGVRSPHIAIGTSAVAVAASAAVNLAPHARQGTVKWRCASVFALCGAVGAWAGSSLGKAADGQKLLALFGAVMVVIGVLMFVRRTGIGKPDVRLDSESVKYLAPRLVSLGFVTGAFSGFFGIGGGFLIVPSPMFATDMPMIAAVGSSLVAVATFGMTTALNYTSSGLVDWPLAALFVAAGLFGGGVGTKLATSTRPSSVSRTITWAVMSAMTVSKGLSTVIDM